MQILDIGLSSWELVAEACLADKFARLNKEVAEWPVISGVNVSGVILNQTSEISAMLGELIRISSRDLGIEPDSRK